MIKIFRLDKVFKIFHKTSLIKGEAALNTPPKTSAPTKLPENTFYRLISEVILPPMPISPLSTNTSAILNAASRTSEPTNVPAKT